MPATLEVPTSPGPDQPMPGPEGPEVTDPVGPNQPAPSGPEMPDPEPADQPQPDVPDVPAPDPKGPETGWPVS